MVFLAFFTGLIAAILGALPPGASNLAVIKTTLQENHRESLKISYGAGLGEVLLALIAFSSGMMVQDFFEMYLWVQYLTAGLLASVGIYFIFKKTERKDKEKKKSSKFILGITLGVINPPVLIYWILIFTLLSKWMLGAKDQSTLWLVLFFLGIFIGKVATLYGYSKFGLHLENRKTDKRSSVNRYIGITLVVLACVQVTRLIIG